MLIQHKKELPTIHSTKLLYRVGVKGVLLLKQFTAKRIKKVYKLFNYRTTPAFVLKCLSVFVAIYKNKTYHIYCTRQNKQLEFE